MSWRKPPAKLIETFEKTAPAGGEVERRTMFGCPCCFVNGNMFLGVHQETMILRLGEADRIKALNVPGVAPFEPMPGRQMREYVAADKTAWADARFLNRWVDKALDYGRSLPPKDKKPAKTDAKKK